MRAKDGRAIGFLEWDLIADGEATHGRSHHWLLPDENEPQHGQLVWACDRKPELPGMSGIPDLTRTSTTATTRASAGLSGSRWLIARKPAMSFPTPSSFLTRSVSVAIHKRYHFRYVSPTSKRPGWIASILMRANSIPSLDPSHGIQIAFSLITT